MAHKRKRLDIQRNNNVTIENCKYNPVIWIEFMINNSFKLFTIIHPGRWAALTHRLAAAWLTPKASPLPAFSRPANFF
jgi:DNA-binding XRE family transcriptional regulator